MLPSVVLRTFAADAARAATVALGKPVVCVDCSGAEHGAREGAVEADGAGGDSPEDRSVLSSVKDTADLPVCNGACEEVVPGTCCKLNGASPQ